MAKYRKRPLVVEAIQLPDPLIQSSEQTAELDAFITKDNEWYWLHNGIELYTPRGPIMQFAPGDWIIKGVEGEYYHCSPSVFAASYDIEGP